jgi:hypothetical protein
LRTETEPDDLRSALSELGWQAEVHTLGPFLWAVALPEDGGQAAARRELSTVGLRVGEVGWMVCASKENGLVADQTPPAGAVVPKGATVNIAIGDDGTHLIGIFGARTPASPANSGQRDNHLYDVCTG